MGTPTTVPSENFAIPAGPFVDDAFVEEMGRRFQRKWLRTSKKSIGLAKSA